MCGRITLTVDPDEIGRWLRIDPGGIFQKRHNIAPTQWVPVVRVDRATGVREALPLRWGFVPQWATELALGNKMINARSETVFQKASFRQAIRARRCIVPVSGFYEWKACPTSRGKRRAFHIHMRDKRPFALAGLWECNEIVPEGPVETFAILTTQANRMMREFHERMPVIIPDDALERWLDPATEALGDLLVPYAIDELQATPVSDYVNDASHEGAKCLAPPPPETLPADGKPVVKKGKSRDAPGQLSLFD